MSNNLQGFVNTVKINRNWSGQYNDTTVPIFQFHSITIRSSFFEERRFFSTYSRKAIYGRWLTNDYRRNFGGICLENNKKIGRNISIHPMFIFHQPAQNIGQHFVLQPCYHFQSSTIVIFCDLHSSELSQWFFDKLGHVPSL